MKIAALAPWYGSKRTLAPRILAELGEHRVYWEPFCGSCAVLFSKTRASYETVNDLHKDLINLALVVQDEELALQLYARVARCIFHEDLLPIAKKILTGRELQGGQPDVERAYWYLVFSWMHLNGISGTPLGHTGTFCVRYSGRGGNGSTRWRSVGESIPDWHRRLLGVQILSRCAFGILERIADEPGTALYLDPPYFAKGASYVHDFADDDHARLAQLLQRFRHARCVLSYYDHPRVRELYPDWTILDSGYLRIAKSMVNSGSRDARGRVEAPEILLINGPSSSTTQSLFEDAT